MCRWLWGLRVKRAWNGLAAAMLAVCGELCAVWLCMNVLEGCEALSGSEGGGGDEGLGELQKQQ